MKHPLLHLPRSEATPVTAPTAPPDTGADTTHNTASAQLRSEELLRGQQAVAIAHNGALYRLQTTRQGKLILTK